jgi:uncharacterized membrane protein SpoIIM required for sporulation
VSGGLRSERFRAAREDDWRELERLLKKAETGSTRSLSDDELLNLPVLYRSAMSSLASARATSLDLALVNYLESLCSRAYYYVYGVRTRLSERIAAYLAYDLPAEMKTLWRETLISAGLFFIGAAVAYLLVMSDPDWFYSFMDRSMSGGRDPSADREFLESTLYDDGESDGLGVFSSFLFTHNAQIALWSFALGFALCLPTVFLITMNGCMLGAFFAVFARQGLAFELGGWLSIHGVTEIFAIILAGAAGLRIGWRVGFPGELSRMGALIVAGRRGAVAVGGVVIMLACAGLLEGFGRQLIHSDIARYSVAAATAVFWAAYFYLPRRNRHVR